MKKHMQVLLYGSISVIALLLFYLTSAVYTPILDSDPLWHLRLGEKMIEQKEFIHTAIFSFDETLPYVAHETAFQLLLAGLHMLGGWNAVFIFWGGLIGLMLYGMIVLMDISKKELNITRSIPSFYLLHVFIVGYLFIGTFSFKPMAISTVIILWFFIGMRAFNERPTWKLIISLSALSFLLSNFHSGVWLVPFILFILHIMDVLYRKKITWRHVWLSIGIIVGGIMNPAGLKGIFYTSQVGEYKSKLISFQPISFSSDLFSYTLVVLFLVVAYFSVSKNLFRLLSVFALLYLGIAGYYSQKFILIFLPYYLPAFGEFIVKKYTPQYRYSLPKKWEITVSVLGVLFLTVLIMKTGIKIDQKKYPVSEMNYILKDHKGKTPPKVLADYLQSGYVIYRGGHVLMDARFDPYLVKRAKNVHNWNEFERGYNALTYGGDYLQEVIRYDKPEYIIIPYVSKTLPESIEQVSMEKTIKEMGKPDFKGSSGMVWKIKKHND